MGTTMSVNTVEEASPPMTAIARGMFGSAGFSATSNSPHSAATDPSPEGEVRRHGSSVSSRATAALVRPEMSTSNEKRTILLRL